MNKNTLYCPCCQHRLMLVDLDGDIKTENVTVSIEEIISTCAAYFGVSEEAIKSKSRKRNYTIPRHITAFLANKYTKLTKNAIGNFLGGRDHTTAIHGIVSVQNYIDTKDPLFFKDILVLTKRIEDRNLELKERNPSLLLKTA